MLTASTVVSVKQWSGICLSLPHTLAFLNAQMWPAYTSALLYNGQYSCEQLSPHCLFAHSTNWQDNYIKQDLRQVRTHSLIVCRWRSSGATWRTAIRIRRTRLNRPARSYGATRLDIRATVLNWQSTQQRTQHDQVRFSRPTQSLSLMLIRMNLLTSDQSNRCYLRIFILELVTFVCWWISAFIRPHCPHTTCRNGLCCHIYITCIVVILLGVLPADAVPVILSWTCTRVNS